MRLIPAIPCPCSWKIGASKKKLHLWNRNLMLHLWSAHPGPLMSQIPQAFAILLHVRVNLIPLIPARDLSRSPARFHLYQCLHPPSLMSPECHSGNKKEYFLKHVSVYISFMFMIGKFLFWLVVWNIFHFSIYWD